MKIAEKEIILRSGKRILLRSPGGEDAGALNAHRQITSRETYFMARYPEEMEYEEKALRKQLEELCAADKAFGISAFCDGSLVADCRVTKVRDSMKYRHRGYFGISIQKAFWGQGLGSLMLQEAIRISRENGFEQLELGAFADNTRAVHLYEKAGFQHYGIQPRAFKLKDGTYRDEVIMVLFL